MCGAGHGCMLPGTIPKKQSAYRRLPPLFGLCESAEKGRQGDVVLYEDEATFRLLPVVRSMWSNPQGSRRLGNRFAL